MRLTDDQWLQIEPILTSKKACPERSRRGGRPRSNDRQVVNGIVWVLLNGTQWADLPPSLGSYTTCWRRYSEWSKTSTWEKIWLILYQTMDQKQRLEWSLALWQGSFVPHFKTHR
jgi:transposase